MIDVAQVELAAVFGDDASFDDAIFQYVHVTVLNAFVGQVFFVGLLDYGKLMGGEILLQHMMVHMA